MLLAVRDLNFTYPDGRQALRGVTFSVTAGESVGLVGPNGAGKSTLLLHLNGVLPEKSGRRGSPAVWINDLPVSASNGLHARQAVGLVFQDPNDQLFCPTTLDDVAFGPLHQGHSRLEAESRARVALAEVGLEGYEDRMPHHLSQGEAKRVCLAGVLACRPALLALDEPTANLDPRARRQLLNLLPRLPMAKLISTHDLEMVRQLCTRVVLLDGGVVRADGPTDEIFRQRALLEQHGLEQPLSIRFEG